MMKRDKTEQGGIRNRRGSSMRQGIRRVSGLIMLLTFPVTMNFFSPYVSLYGAWSGLLSGAVMLFVSLFVSSMVMGRAFCGWACPAGAFQDLLRPARDRRVVRGRWLKYAVWAAWFGALAVGFAMNRPLKPAPLFLTENGVSVAEPVQYATYGSVVGLFLLLALTVGRRGACHTVCWIAPFLVGGRTLGNLLSVPGLRLRSDAGVCTACGTCVGVCPMSLDVRGMVRSGKMEHADCALCGECVDACPEHAVRFGFGGSAGTEFRSPSYPAEPSV